MRKENDWRLKFVIKGFKFKRVKSVVFGSEEYFLWIEHNGKITVTKIRRTLQRYDVKMTHQKERGWFGN